MEEQLTVSATECARLTGITRERLRTWERRHGFPSPVRPDGRRRYALADVPALIAARRAIDAGVPVAEAIAAARSLPATPQVPAAALAESFDAAPLPAIVVGAPPEPTVLHVNRAARLRAGAPLPGAVLEGELAGRAGEAFAAGGPVRFERAPWGEDDPPVPCVAVPVGADDPLLVLFDLETGGAQDARAAAQAASQERDLTQEQLDERDAALALGSALAEPLRTRPGVAAIAECVELLYRSLGAVDAALAPYMGGQIVVGRSARGLLGPEMLTVAAHPALVAAVREGEIATAAGRAAQALEVPEGLCVLAVPAACAGETLAVLLLLFDEPPEPGAGTLALLDLAGPALALALMHERLLTGEPGAGR